MLANSFSRGLNGFDIRVNEMVCIMWNWLRMFLAVRALLGRGYTDYIALVEFWVLFWVLYCLLQLEIRSSATVCSFWYMVLSLSLTYYRCSSNAIKAERQAHEAEVTWVFSWASSGWLEHPQVQQSLDIIPLVTLVQAVVFVLSLWSYNNFPLHTPQTPGSCMCHV